MANIFKGMASKTKELGGKAVDLAGKGALYSQMFRNPNQQMTMGQRIGGALADSAMNATLGQMGSLGQAVRAGLTSKGDAKSPTGGGGVPGTTVGGKPIKTESVVQAISQSTQQILGGLNTLNATFRMGLNATANQIQSQSSVMGSVKRDTEDMAISLREIYEVLNKQGYQSRNAQNLSSAGQRVDGAPITSQNQNNQGILQDLITGALLSAGSSLITRMIPMISAAAIPALGGLLTHFFDSDSSKAGNSIVGSWINENIPGAASIDDFIFRMSGGFVGTDINDPRYSWNQSQKESQTKNPNKSRAEAITKPNITPPGSSSGASAGPNIPSAPNPNKSRAEAIKTPAELSKAEIDEIFRIAPMNASDDVLFEIAKQKFPGRKYNTLKQRIQMLRSLMQPQSSLSTGVQVASADMSSGDYLVSRQKMLENSRTGTSEQALRQEEQKLEKDAFEGVIPQLLNYESREMMYKADKIVFDAGKIEFLQGIGMGAGGEGGLIPGGGADNWRPGGTESRDGSGIGGGPVTRVPELSTETKAAADQLQKSNTFKVAPGTSDPLGQYSEEQLRGQGIVSHTNTDGTKVYSYAPGGIGGHADKIGGSGASQSVAPAGKFRPVYQGVEADIKDEDLINIIGNEARNSNESIDAVINNMMNRLGSSSYGNAESLSEVAKQKGQYESWDFLQSGRFKPVDKKKAELIRERMRLIASGQVEDPTQGANEFRARSYLEGEGRGLTFDRKARAQGFRDLGGNVYADTGYEKGPFAPYSVTGQTPAQAPGGPTAVAPSLVAGLQGMTPANQQAVAGVGPGNVNVKEAYGPGRPKRPDESIRNIASSAAEKAGMSAITFTSGKGDWISPERKAGGQKTTQHSTGRALDVDGFASDAERAAFIEEAVSMGANGVGVYKGGSIHIDEGDFRSWDLAKKKIYQDAIARGMEKRKKLQEEKQKQADAEKVEEQKPKVKITEESGQEKAYSKFGVTKESKQKMIAESQAKPAAPPMPPAATPAMLDPTSVQSSQKVSELSKKTTMNREASTKQGPVTQNIVNNSNPKTDTTGTGFPDKNAPMLAMTDTMEKFTSHLFGMA